MEKINEQMKQQTNFWQVIAVCLTICVPISIGLIKQGKEVAALRTDVTNIQLERFNDKMQADKKFDKMDAKMDLIQNDTRQILIRLESKADRK